MRCPQGQSRVNVLPCEQLDPCTMSRPSFCRNKITETDRAVLQLKTQRRQLTGQRKRVRNDFIRCSTEVCAAQMWLALSAHACLDLGAGPLHQQNAKVDPKKGRQTTLQAGGGSHCKGAGHREGADCCKAEGACPAGAEKEETSGGAAQADRCIPAQRGAGKRSAILRASR